MKLTFAIEPVAACWNEVMVLATQHWQGTKSYRRHEPFCPSFDRYHACNQSGFFQLFTARDGETLAGYFGVYVTDSMHSQKRMATEDTFYLAPAYRGSRTALRFLQHIEKQLVEWGVTEIMFSCEVDNESGIKGLLTYLQFRPVIIQYSKRLSVFPPASDTGAAQMEPVQCQNSPSSN
jgi:GNAT superfamily N-acetyltransferase